MHQAASRSPKVLLIIATLVMASSCSSNDESSTLPSSTEQDPSSTTSTSTPSTTTSSTEQENDDRGQGRAPGDIGVLGCSNTAQHVEGYLALSDVDRLIRIPLGGGDFLTWGDPDSEGYDGYWQRLFSDAVAGEVGAIWVQLCIRGEDLTEMTSTHQTAVTHIVDRIRGQYGDITIYLSGLNLYEDGYVCRKTDEFGVAISWDLVDWAVVNLGVVEGPETGPLGPGTVNEDGCHLSAAGEQLVGAQLVDWFDFG